MKLRRANQQDVHYFIECAYRLKETHFKNVYDDLNLNDEYLTLLFNTMMGKDGLCCVVESDGIDGMMAGIIGPNVWIPEKLYLINVLLYSDKTKFRAGYKLVDFYVKESNKMIEQKTICGSVINVDKHVADIDFAKFGYSVHEQSWMIGK